jgi:hypothetical protein
VTAVLIVAIICAALLAAYVFGTWMRWAERREDHRAELLERLLPIDGNTPEYVLDVVEALAKAGPGSISRQHLRVMVLGARLQALHADVREFEGVIARQRAAATGVRRRTLP